MRRRLRLHALALLVPLLTASCDWGNTASAIALPPFGQALKVRSVAACVLVRVVEGQTEGSQAVMASLPGGTFTMGDRKDSVTVQPFALDVTEVTADAYAECVNGGGCAAGSAFRCNAGETYGVSGKGNHPMNCVEWKQATAYCQWAQKRLPTEEEWEWAARGQSRGSEYPWGDDAPGSRACWAGEGSGLANANRHATCPVGAFPAGDAPGGIHDLAGNVWEWTASQDDDRTRVVRGGGWSDRSAAGLRGAYRDRNSPVDTNADLGFRCAR